MKNRTAQNKKGFTLIELLVVIGILAILFAIVLIAINPARQFAQARDTQKRNDTLQILNAIHQFAAENNGNLPANMPTPADPGDPANEVRLAWDGSTADAPGDICDSILEIYIPSLPRQPEDGGAPITDCSVAYNTNYWISVDQAGRVTVRADANDVNGQPITRTR